MTTSPISLKALAERLEVSYSTLYAHVRRGSFAVQRLGKSYYVDSKEVPAIRRDLQKLRQGPPGLTVSEAAELLGVERGTVYSLIRVGSLKTTTVGAPVRISPRELERYRQRRAEWKNGRKALSKS